MIGTCLLKNFNKDQRQNCIEINFKKLWLLVMHHSYALGPSTTSRLATRRGFWISASPQTIRDVSTHHLNHLYKSNPTLSRLSASIIYLQNILINNIRRFLFSIRIQLNFQ